VVECVPCLLCIIVCLCTSQRYYHFTSRFIPLCISPQVADFVRAAAECALQIHARGLQASPGDVLIFLPGMEEVDQCCEYVKEQADNRDG